MRDLIDHGEFDTIYHEHLCYFSVTALRNLFERHGLFLNRVEPLAIHGGSLRLFVEKHDAPGRAPSRSTWRASSASAWTVSTTTRASRCAWPRSASELTALLQD